VRLRTLAMPLAVTLLAAIFVYLIGGRVVALMRTGEPVAVVLGGAIGVVALIALGAIVKEWLFASRVSRMSNEMFEQGTLIADDLPRSPGGRIDRAAADEQFDRLREVVELDQESWQAWFNLGFAYDAAGDRKRARAALRKADALRRTGAPREGRLEK